MTWLGHARPRRDIRRPRTFQAPIELSVRGLRAVGRALRVREYALRSARHRARALRSPDARFWWRRRSAPLHPVFAAARRELLPMAQRRSRSRVCGRLRSPASPKVSRKGRLRRCRCRREWYPTMVTEWSARADRVQAATMQLFQLPPRYKAG